MFPTNTLNNPLPREDECDPFVFPHFIFQRLRLQWFFRQRPHLVCPAFCRQQPTDHKLLFEWVNELDGLGQRDHLEFSDHKGRRHIYRWVNQAPLNGSPNADQVNFFEYWLKVDQKVTYHNSWVTDITVDKNNVVELVLAGRSRWKIENETFNTLKNQGYHRYHIEHNFGHGQQYLSNTFFVLNLLAFYIHQILELCDKGYQYCRSKFSSRKEFWNNLRAAIRIMLFRDFDHLLRNVAGPPEIRAP